MAEKTYFEKAMDEAETRIAIDTWQNADLKDIMLAGFKHIGDKVADVRTIPPVIVPAPTVNIPAVAPVKVEVPTPRITLIELKGSSKVALGGVFTAGGVIVGILQAFLS